MTCPKHRWILGTIRRCQWGGKAPGRGLCIGAGYIALECGGFVNGLGSSTTAMVRSILLRGFDRECVDKIQTHLVAHGVKLQKDMRVAERLNGFNAMVASVVNLGRLPQECGAVAMWNSQRVKDLASPS